MMQALTAWELKFQVCLRHTFTAATLGSTVAEHFTRNPKIEGSGFSSGKEKMVKKGQQK